MVGAILQLSRWLLRPSFFPPFPRPPRSRPFSTVANLIFDPFGLCWSGQHLDLANATIALGKSKRLFAERRRNGLAARRLFLVSAFASHIFVVSCLKRSSHWLPRAQLPIFLFESAASRPSHSPLVFVDTTEKLSTSTLKLFCQPIAHHLSTNFCLFVCLFAIFPWLSHQAGHGDGVGAVGCAPPFGPGLPPPSGAF
jgi:hypothetical protein